MDHLRSTKFAFGMTLFTGERRAVQIITNSQLMRIALGEIVMESSRVAVNTFDTALTVDILGVNIAVCRAMFFHTGEIVTEEAVPVGRPLNIQMDPAVRHKLRFIVLDGWFVEGLQIRVCEAPQIRGYGSVHRPQPRADSRRPAIIQSLNLFV